MKRYIDADVLIKTVASFQNNKNHQYVWKIADVISLLKETADRYSVEIVRCLDCEWFHMDEQGCYCDSFDGMAEPTVDGFCSYGEKKAGE